jgi:hypothetical protein
MAMRVLFAVQHFYQPQERPFYGSQSADNALRARALAACLLALYQTFDARQGLLDGQKRIAHPANTADPIEVSVTVCTTRGLHLIRELSHLQHLFVHRQCDRDPLFLGLECHGALREGLDRFDYFCFLEDDLLLTDPAFFRKLEWFGGIAGGDAVLQPNRYEVAVGQPLHKLYIDGNLADATLSPRFQNVADRPRIEAEALGRRHAFQRVNNPHSGCFFLDARKMAHWSSQPDFLVPDAGFAGPLESSATLGIIRHFRVYKPARENAAFLEVRHLGNRYLGERLRFQDGSPLKF